MTFTLRMGVPEMQEFYENMMLNIESQTCDADETHLYKKFLKALSLLAQNPRHNSLQSHEIEVLSRRVGYKVWQSYLENNTPSAGRIFWGYGPEQGTITIFALEPHPEDAKKSGYQKIRLSAFPPAHS
jgi:hypothetical protein